MYVAIGRILKTSGVEGELKAAAYSGIPERFLHLKSLYIRTEEGFRGFVIESVTVQDNTVLLRLKNISSREAAKALVGKEIFVPEEQRLEAPEGFFFLDDVIGLTVFDISGEKIGTVTDVISHSANEIFVIQAGQKEILVPAVRQFIKELNIPEGKMIVELIDGMVEE